MLDISGFMDSNKGQQVLTAVLLTGVILTVSSSAYFWGRSMLDKSQDQRNFEEMEKLIKDINRNIKQVSSRGGRREMEFDLPEGAELSLNEAPSTTQMDNITLSFTVEGKMMATDQDIAIVGSKGSEAPITQDPDVITARSEGGGENYAVKFKLYYKNVTVENEPKKRIDLDSVGRKTAMGETTSLIIEQGPTEDGEFTVNKVEVRIV